MEAPEKLYIDFRDRAESTWRCTYTEKVMANDIEYTRTDSFIEKALKFFTENFEVEDYNDNIDVDDSPIFNYGRFIEDFKKYMKGE